MKKKIAYEIRTYSKVPRKLKTQVEKICHECFYARMPKKEVKENKDKYCSKGYAHILALENSSVISTVELFRRVIRYKGKKIILGGIGGLCTVKKKRGKGIASYLMKKSMEDLRKQKCEVAFLCTNIKDPKLGGLYKKFGFVIMKQPYTFLGKSGKRYTEKNGMIALVRSKSKFNLILKGKETLDIGYGGL
ncbi:MAG: GNAT family N-acetyltransferase [Candidatus Pacearchaeota archaeon]|nr:MAG: GNAT family N-acetyltransferase [Candidatus Pacearchaeota archaeon]